MKSAKTNEPDEVTVAEAARRLGLAPQNVGAWAKRPGAPARVAGRHVFVRWPAFARWRESEQIREAQPGDLETARTRKANAEAELAEIDLAQRRGEVVLVADYETALGTVLDRLCARLRGLPVQLGASLGPDVEAAADAEVERIIVELSQFDEDVVDEPDSADITPT